MARSRPSASRRLRATLGVAALAHVLPALAMRLVRAPAPEASGAAAVDVHEFAVDLAITTLARDLLPPESIDAPGRSGPATIARVRPVSAALPVGASSEPGPASSEDVVADRSWSFDPLRPAATEIGLGAYGRGLGAGAAHETAAEQAREAGQAVGRSLRAALEARDVERGLARTGPLVAAVHEAASLPGAPTTGAATINVECDAVGTVTSARADDQAWREVASSVVRLMKAKTVRTPPGARGLRANLRVEARLRPPSGGEGRTSVGAVPDDVPGGGSACDGKGLTRRCVGGMPVGITSSSHDVVDLGAKRERVVHVTLVSETEI